MARRVDVRGDGMRRPEAFGRRRDEAFKARHVALIRLEPELVGLWRDDHRLAAVNVHHVRARRGGEDRQRVDLAAVRVDRRLPDASEADEPAFAFVDGIRLLSLCRPRLPFVKPVGGHEASPAAEGVFETRFFQHGFGARINERAQDGTKPQRISAYSRA